MNSMTNNSCRDIIYKTVRKKCDKMKKALCILLSLVFVFACLGSSAFAVEPVEITAKPASTASAINFSNLPFSDDINGFILQAASSIWVLCKTIQDFFIFGNREVTPVEKIVDSSLTPLASTDPANPHLMGMWCPPRAELMTDFAATDLLFKDVAAAGFNMMWYYFPGTDKAQLLLDAAQANGLTVLMSVPGGKDFDKNNAAHAAVITQFKDHPALYGFNIMDEPSAVLFPQLAEVKAGVKEIMGSTDKPVIVNLFPNYASNTQLGYPDSIGRAAAYETHVKDYCDVFNPEILCYDHYPFSKKMLGSKSIFEKDMMTYFENISTIRTYAWQQNVPMWLFVQAVSWGGMANPTKDQQRFLMNAALVFGVKNTLYFFYQTPFAEDTQGEGFTKYPVDFEGNKTEDYYKVQQVNAEFNNYVDIYAGFESKGVLLYKPSPGMQATVSKGITLPDDFAGIKKVKAYDGALKNKTLIIGGFENEAKSLEGLYVFNYDYENATNAEICFDAVKQIEVYGDGGLEQIFTGDKVEMTLSEGGAKFIVLG
jgi:hypothetical protein